MYVCIRIRIYIYIYIYIHIICRAGWLSRCATCPTGSSWGISRARTFTLFCAICVEVLRRFAETFIPPLCKMTKQVLRRFAETTNPRKTAEKSIQSLLVKFPRSSWSTTRGRSQACSSRTSRPTDATHLLLVCVCVRVYIYIYIWISL